MLQALRWKLFAILVSAAVVLSACRAVSSTVAPVSVPPAADQVHPVHLISLAGPAAEKQAELSGMTNADGLIWLLPQYPSRFKGGPGGAVFAFNETEAESAIANKTELTPRSIPFDDEGLSRSVEGFDGFEGIAICGNDVYLTIEVRGAAEPAGYLVRGTIDAQDGRIVLSAESLTPLIGPVAIYNHSFESVFCTNNRVVTMFEANGRNIDPKPVALVFERDLTPVAEKEFPALEYRVTDATPPDDQGKFWVVNYFFTGDKSKLQPADDQWGNAEGHGIALGVERLVELQWDEEKGISLADAEPIWLEKGPEERNWEGAARLGDGGILLATDSYPSTLIGYVDLATP